jgi:predicted nucleic acid-binding protein
MSRRRRRNRIEMAPDAELALAWYSREAWERLRQVADDVHALDDTYEDWERQALRAIRDLESHGRPIRKVAIDIDALLAWCREHHRRNDSKARAEYTAELLRGTAQGGSGVSK